MHTIDVLSTYRVKTETRCLDILYKIKFSITVMYFLTLFKIEAQIGSMLHLRTVLLAALNLNYKKI